VHSNPPILTVSDTGSALHLSVNLDNYYIETYFTFTIRITTQGGQAHFAESGTVYTLNIVCGSASTSISFGSHPTGYSDTQYASSASSPFYLPTMISSLLDSHPATSCGPESA